MASDQPEVLGIGRAAVHYYVTVPEEWVTAPGTTTFIDEDALQHLLDSNRSSTMFHAGGSTTNILKALNSLGHTCALIGKIGKDEPGQNYKEGLESHNVIPHLIESGKPTSQIVHLITADRKLRADCILKNSAGHELNAADLVPDLFKGVKLVHIAGELIENEELTKRVLDLAKEAGAKVSFNLANLGNAERYKRLMIDLLARNVDIVFANAEETKVLTGLPPEQGCAILKDLTETAVVKMGVDGCWAANGSEKVYQPAFQVEAVDITGAGDFFAAGFLHGYLKKKTLVESVRYGALLASNIVQHVGTEIPKEKWSLIKKNF